MTKQTKFGFTKETAEALDARRYRFLRSRDLHAIHLGGVFAGMTPENLVLNGAALDAAVDSAIAGGARTAFDPFLLSGIPDRWRCDTDGVIRTDDDTGRVVAVAGNPEEALTDWDVANLRLMLAAECMLDALRSALPHLEAQEDRETIGDEGCWWPAEMVRGAIKAATEA